jgi:DoxX-like family
MPAPVLVLLIAASAVLVVEFGMTAAAGLAAYPPGIERFAHLTGLTPSPLVYRVLGLLALAGVVGVIAGIWWPAAAIAGATYFALLAGFTLVRQVSRGQRRGDLVAYALYLVSALVVIAIRAV